MTKHNMHIFGVCFSHDKQRSFLFNLLCVFGSYFRMLVVILVSDYLFSLKMRLCVPAVFVCLFVLNGNHFYEWDYHISFMSWIIC